MSTAIAVPIDPPRVAEPTRHPIIVTKYFRMGETGVLDPGARVELLDLRTLF